MEYIEVNLDWLITRIRQATKGLAVPYVLFDCPGQVELYTHNEVMTKITQQLVKALDLRLVAVHLIDSTLCVDVHRYISAVMLSLAAMMQMELPHINVLTKIDLVMDNTDDLTFRLDYYAGVQDLSHLLRTLHTNNHPLSIKFGEFNRLLAELIEDYGLVNFEPLDIQDKECTMRVLARCDTASGHIMHAEKIEDPSDPMSGLKLFHTAVSDAGEPIEDYLDRYEERFRERQSEEGIPEEDM
uniref:GPN-loop GTPase 2 n=1 Tax=Alexandrium catenella TaxID=2925 RepID=A0A7S1RKH8_ALECA